MNGKCPTPRAQKTGKSHTLSRGGTLGDSLDTSIMYQSVPSLTTLPGDPGGSHVLTSRVSGFWQKFLFPGNRVFELEKFYTVLKEKCRNFLICFKETGGSLKSRCSCVVSHQFSHKQYISNVLAFQYCFHNFYLMFCGFFCWIFKNNCPGGGL